MDLIIRKANALGHNGLVDIGILDGKIKKIEPTILERGIKEINVDGKLVTAGLIDEHIHLDKALTRNWVGDVGDTLELNIIRGREIKSQMTVEDLIERGSTIIRKYVSNGTTAIRTSIEIDPVIGDQGIIAIKELKRVFKSIIDIQTVAFPQEGWFYNPGTIELGCEDYVKKAMQLGIDSVGGNINAGIWPSDPKKQIDRIFDIAKEYNAPIDVHIDNYDSDIAFALPYLCEQTIKNNYEGRVVAAHAIGTAHVDRKTRNLTIQNVKEAGITIAVMPNRINLTSVREFMEAGVNISVGSDGFKDAFVYLSNANVLHSMLLLAHLLHLKNIDDLYKIFDMGTINAARAMELESYGLAEGRKADIVVMNTSSLEEAIMEVPICSYVLKNGKIVAKSGKYIGKGLELT